MSRISALVVLGLALVLSADAAEGRRATLTSSDPCGREAAAARLGAMVGALNHARGDRFAAGFTTRGRWYPFTRSLVRPLTGRADIMAFAIIRIGAEDEWKLGALGRLGRGRYIVRVAIVSNGRPVGRGTTRVTVDCRSGLVASWIGPALEMPPVVDDD